MLFRHSIICQFSSDHKPNPIPPPPAHKAARKVGQFWPSWRNRLLEAGPEVAYDNPNMPFQESDLRLNTFAEMNLSPATLSALAKMSVTEPTPIQAQAIPVALGGQDMIAIARAGSGKTLAFALPILAAFERNPQSRALVLVPSREVAMQTFAVFEALGKEAPFKACLVIGGLPGNKQDSQLKKKPRLIVATPGRMNDLLRNNKLLLQGVSTVVVDEADRMLGLGFVPQLKDIQSTLRGTWQTLLFSATFGPDVEAVAAVLMRENGVIVRAGDRDLPPSTLQQTIYKLSEGAKNALLIEELRGREKAVIVFASSQESADEIFRHLKQNGQSVDMIHGALSQGHRSRVVRDFREAKFRILVTTDLLARGLDVPGVELVINFDLPFSAEDFLHRIGRTARAGRNGRAITFITPHNSKKFEAIQPYVKDAKVVTK